MQEGQSITLTPSHHIMYAIKEINNKIGQKPKYKYATLLTGYGNIDQFMEKYRIKVIVNLKSFPIGHIMIIFPYTEETKQKPVWNTSRETVEILAGSEIVLMIPRCSDDSRQLNYSVLEIQWKPQRKK